LALVREFACDLLALGLGDVERDRFLVAIHRDEIGGFAGVLSAAVLHPGWAPASRVVARAGALDLDHLGAEVGKVLRRPGPGEDAREVEDADVRKRAGHGGPIRQGASGYARPRPAQQEFQAGALPPARPRNPWSRGARD